MLSFTSHMNLILTLFTSVSRIAFLDPHDHAVTYQNKQHNFRSRLSTDRFYKPGNRTVAFQFSNDMFCRHKACFVPGAGCSVKQANKVADVGIMGRIAMQQGDYQEALRLLSMDLNQISPHSTQFTRLLLADRAECFWKLGHAREAVQDAMDAIRAGFPSDDKHSEVRFFFFCHVNKSPQALNQSFSQSINQSSNQSIM